MSCRYHVSKYKLKKPYEEKDLQEKIGRWLKENPMDHVGEVKIVPGGTLSFSKFRDQQLPSLARAAGKRGKYHKLTDASTGAKPFDHFCAVNKTALVFCQFWKNDQQDICYYMHIQDVMKIMESGAKSIKEEDFMRIGETIDLGPYKYNKKKKRL